MQFQHTPRLGRGLAIAGLAATMTIPATPTPATAAFGQTVGHRDPAHDVVKRTTNSDVIVARNEAGDIVHVRFTHTSRRVVTTVRVRDFRGEWHWHGLIQTPTRRYRVGGEGQGTFSILVLENGAGTREIRCRGLSTKIERDKNTLRVSVPTACLHRPRWARTGLIYELINSHGDYLDDAMRDGVVLSDPALSRRLRTG
jgi:hypothetical protein